jgi:hypothetical protein
VGVGQRIASLAAFGRGQRLAHRHLHGVELMVAGHLLHDVPAAVVLEQNWSLE